jgi:hypothetical protein
MKVLGVSECSLYLLNLENESKEDLKVYVNYYDDVVYPKQLNYNSILYNDQGASQICQMDTRYLYRSLVCDRPRQLSNIHTFFDMPWFGLETFDELMTYDLRHTRCPLYITDKYGNYCATMPDGVHILKLKNNSEFSIYNVVLNETICSVPMQNQVMHAIVSPLGNIVTWTNNGKVSIYKHN